MLCSVVCAARALPACALNSGSDPEPRARATAQPIIGGKNSDSSEDAVVILYRIDGGMVASCSGTLIAANLVLTARHCVSETANGSFSCDSKGVGSAGGAAGKDFAASSILVYTGTLRPDPDPKTANAKGSQIFHDGAKNLCNHDLALVVLDTPIENALIAPVRLDAPAVVGETFTAVGWGVTLSSPYPATRQQRKNVKVQYVGPVSTDIGIDVPSSELEVGESICEGDSGGPALDTTTGAVIGVVSRGGNGAQPSQNDPSATCVGGENFYTQTSPFKDTIQAAADAAGAEIWVEGGPDPRLAKFGEACDAPEACRSSLCLKSACTLDCSADATLCPSGYDCQSIDGTKQCAKTPPPPPSGGCATTERRPDAWPVIVGLGIAGAVLRRRRDRA